MKLDRGEKSGMRRYFKGLRDEDKDPRTLAHHQKNVKKSESEVADMVSKRESSKATAHQLAAESGGTFYETRPPIQNERNLHLSNPNKSGMAHHFEDAE